MFCETYTPKEEACIYPGKSLWKKEKANTHSVKATLWNTET